MYVEKLTLKNYRGIRDLSIDFDKQLNVIVGDNGCGKTTILDALTKGVFASNYELTTGAERQKKEAALTIANKDIYQNEDEASFNVSFSMDKDSKVNVVASSYPPDIKSNAKNVFKKWPYFACTYFPADRGGDLHTLLPPKEDALNSLASVDYRIPHLISKDSLYCFALKWIMDEQNYDNALFRRHIESGGNKENFLGNNKLQFIKEAIASATDFQDFTFRSEDNRFEVIKSFETNEAILTFEQLSLGEQVFIGLVATIAYNVVAGSDKFINGTPIKSNIFLIDEVDLHLHPKWQRKIISALLDTFPTCQFIITTHSPQILGEVPAENIHVLKRNSNGDVVCSRPERSRGLNSAEVLTEVMEQVAMNEELLENLGKIYLWIEKEEFEEAKNLLSKCEKTYGELPSLLKARTVLDYSMPESA